VEQGGREPPWIPGELGPGEALLDELGDADRVPLVVPRQLTPQHQLVRLEDALDPFDVL
jgi:hypothetical protein